MVNPNVTSPGTNVRRIFTTRELRALTRRKYERLPEVQLKKIDAKRKEDYRTNKLMAEVFTKVRNVEGTLEFPAHPVYSRNTHNIHTER